MEDKREDSVGEMRMKKREDALLEGYGRRERRKNMIEVKLKCLKVMFCWRKGMDDEMELKRYRN